eukprot:TRINITY_DN1602_c0_g1_i1.p2 TRINITY_DN1602_c0_g1~~TRINITY_DN1602_c0_g1_i1.p2  ORF type:complete len:122 (+),score=51.74 TRINITY_DN1602_c0_g1_i1:51-368(+)
MSTPTEDKKVPIADASAPAAPAASSDHVNVKVVGQDGSEVFFKIKRTTTLKKLMEAYCKRLSVNEKSVRFLFNGSRITDQQTPNDLGLEDDDIIDAMLSQVGGAF